MSKNVFELKNIDCAYKKSSKNHRIILSVKELNIPSGKMIFIIGPSGIGKSTILETLGMMNNTLVVGEGSKFMYHHPTEEESTDLIAMWKRNKDKELSSFRRSNFSFIFQQTNLMRNFSAYHNVMVTAMLQGTSQRESALMAKELFATIKMPAFNMERKPTELSGGQQQRLAFARAIIPQFNILFGDEPTGNLDSNNASLLISQMRDQLKAMKNSTAVIVSHDLEVAVRFADIIIQIQGEKDSFDEIKLGLIDKKSVFEKIDDTNWKHLNTNYSNSMLLNQLKTNIHDYTKSEK